MTLWYCQTCDTYFDSDTQDQADYDRDMCGNCVQLEKEEKAFRANPMMDFALSWRNFA